MVAAAGGAPAVTTRTPRGTLPRTLAGALASPIRTVGAAHSQVTCSSRINRKTSAGSGFGRQMWVPEVAVADPQPEVKQCSDGVQIGIAVGDHHALRPCRRPARVVDGEQVALAYVRTGEVRRFGREGRLVVEPSGA